MERIPVGTLVVVLPAPAVSHDIVGWVGTVIGYWPAGKRFRCLKEDEEPCIAFFDLETHVVEFPSLDTDVLIRRKYLLPIEPGDDVKNEEPLEVELN